MDNITGTRPTGGGTSMNEPETTERSSLKEKAHEARETITAKARETKARVKGQGEHLLRDQKNRVADQIGHYSSAVHRAAQDLEEEQDATIAYYTHRAADQLDHAAEYLREHDWTHLKRDAEDLARRHQDLFFGGLLLGGFALARLLKASQHHEGSSRVSTESHTRSQPTEYAAPAHSTTPDPYGTAAPYGAAAPYGTPAPGSTAAPEPYTRL